jgi:hypothetical protein
MRGFATLDTQARSFPYSSVCLLAGTQTAWIVAAIWAVLMLAAIARTVRGAVSELLPGSVAIHPVASSPTKFLGLYSHHEGSPQRGYCGLQFGCAQLSDPST